MSENAPEELDGEPGTIADPELGIPGEVEPLTADPLPEGGGPDGPDELGQDADDITDDAPVEVDPGTEA